MAEIKPNSTIVDLPKARSGFRPPVSGEATLGPMMVTFLYKCPFCTRHWEREFSKAHGITRAMKYHVRQMHPSEYHGWLLKAGLRGFTKQEKQARHIERIRGDRDQTEARYDEIIKLRMLLLDIMETAECDALARRIERASATWGKKGDCV